MGQFRRVMSWKMVDYINGLEEFLMLFLNFFFHFKHIFLPPFRQRLTFEINGGVNCFLFITRKPLMMRRNKVFIYLFRHISLNVKGKIEKTISYISCQRM